MTVESPKIDKRTYEEIVAQTEALAGCLTCVVAPTETALLGRTLAQDIGVGGQTLATSGTEIDEDLAKRLSKIQSLNRVRVVGWQGVREVDPKPENLVRQILMQDVVQSLPVAQPAALLGQTLAQDIQNRAIASRGTVIDAVLAEQLRQVPGLTSVEVVLARQGTVIDAALATKISQIPDLPGVKVRRNRPIQADAGGALVRIFARMALQVSDRLNRVPDKNFLAFLDLIGTQIHPPQPARVPLTFSLVENSPVDAFVPAGTQVAAPAAEGETEVVFELEEELVVMRSRLQAVGVRQPARDRYSDQTAAATGQVNSNYPAFVADRPIDHLLYVACDDLLTLPGDKTATLTLSGAGAGILRQLPITWSTFNPETETWTVIKGIVEGLTVVIDAFLPQITVLPGRAINRETATPQLFNLTAVQTLASVPDHRNKTVWVLLTLEGSNTRVVLQTADAPFDNTSRLCLACLSVDNQGMFSEAPWSSLKTNNNPWSVKFTPLSPLLPHAINQQSAAWLRGRLDTPMLPLPPNPATENLPQVDRIDVAVEMNRNGLSADTCLYNTTPLDTSKPFYPLGEQPRFNDTFYLGNRTVLSQPGTVVVLQVILAGEVRNNGGIELAWEIWTGMRWEELGRSSATNSNLTNRSDFSDGTNALTVGVASGTSSNFTVNATNFAREQGRIKFKIPNSIASTAVSGEENYWIRARITKGNYGQAARTQKSTITIAVSAPSTTTTSTASGGTASTAASPTPVQLPVYDLIAADFAPPIIEALTIAYTLAPAAKPATCLTYNDFTYNQPTAAFRPFTRTRDRHAALYLGFDQPLPNRPITLYLQVEALEPGKLTERTTRTLPSLEADRDRRDKVRVEVVRGFQPGQMVRVAPGSGVQEDREIVAIQPDSRSAAGDLTLRSDLVYPHPAGTRVQRIPSPPRLVWEYATGANDWRSLGAIDETQFLTERGRVQFIGPADAVARQEFGQTLYWLRLRWDGGELLVQPRLRRVLTNTAWAVQAVTLRHEVLGSSTGNPNQRFFTSQAPVLPGVVLEVREDLSLAEREDLMQRDRFLNILRDETGVVEEVWVRWQEVADFYGSEMGDRHYVLNHLTGEVLFGDGQRGRVPPLGGQNIRLHQYLSGGGSQGNKPAATIAELKTTLPYIDAVVNLEAASGAADQESLERVKERGPKRLRHRDRAVTAQDLEDLTLEASSEVARVRALPPVFSDALEWLPVYHIPAETQGSLEVQIDWTGSSIPFLLVSLYSPGQAMPLVQQRLPKLISGSKPPNNTITLPLTASASPIPWRLTISNPHTTEARDVNGAITYPNGSGTVAISSLSPTPHSEVVDAGRVELIIVPRSQENRPTPSLGLLNQVEQYLRERNPPTLALHVTEPDWVEITVRATLVPVSFEGADAARDRALQSLTRFLHPLTGGTAGRGWDFGRRPWKSDIYALLESVEGIDFVKDLTITEAPPIRPDTPDNFLIYSGTHSLLLLLP